MSTDLSSSKLRHLLTLTERKDSLTAELATVTGQLQAFFDGAPAKIIAVTKAERGRKPKAVKTAPATKRKAKGKRLKHGAAKELILNGLKEAGKVGISVKDLAPKIGMKASTVQVWIYTTGKKLGEVEKIGRGRYRYAEVKEAPVAVTSKRRLH